MAAAHTSQATVWVAAMAVPQRDCYLVPQRPSWVLLAKGQGESLHLMFREKESMPALPWKQRRALEKGPTLAEATDVAQGKFLQGVLREKTTQL